MSKTRIAFAMHAALAASSVIVSRQNREKELRVFEYDEALAEAERRDIEERERIEEQELARQAEEYARIKAHKDAQEQVIYDAAKAKRARKAAKRIATMEQEKRQWVGPVSSRN